MSGRKTRNKPCKLVLNSHGPITIGNQVHKFFVNGSWIVGVDARLLIVLVYIFYGVCLMVIQWHSIWVNMRGRKAIGFPPALDFSLSPTKEGLFLFLAQSHMVFLGASAQATKLTPRYPCYPDIFCEYSWRGLSDLHLSLPKSTNFEVAFFGSLG